MIKKAKRFQIFFPFIALFMLGILSVPLSSSASDTNSPSDDTPVLTIDAGQQFVFAEKYFSTGDYSRAIGEYNRFIHFFPEDIRVERAMHRIGMASFKDGQFVDGVRVFERLIDRFKDTDLAIKSYLMISECYVKLDRAGSAVANLHKLIAITDKPDVKDEANYRIGWIYLEAISWENAGSYFEKISIKNREKYSLSELFAGLSKKDNLKKKDPTLAGLLSIVPGAGYVYLRRYRDALTAFIVNSSLIYAAYTSFDNDNPALGGIVAFVGSGFYAGSIYGTVTSTRKYNRMQTSRFIERLKANTRINLSADVKKKGVLISLRYVF